MAFDAGMLSCTLAQLCKTALGARIEKVYQPERDEIILQMRSFEGGKRLLINAGSNNPVFLLDDVLSELDDGLLDVLIVKGDNPLETINTIFHFINRMSRKYPQGVHHMKCKELTVHCNGVFATDIDGQPGPRFPVKITCEKGGLRIIRPKK